MAAFSCKRPSFLLPFLVALTSVPNQVEPAMACTCMLLSRARTSSTSPHGTVTSSHAQSKGNTDPTDHVLLCRPTASAKLVRYSNDGILLGWSTETRYVLSALCRARVLTAGLVL